jgi:hypothetical protein
MLRVGYDKGFEVAQIRGEEMNDDRLYIIMRRDLASLTPGKAVAQGSHAATKFLYDVFALKDIEGTIFENIPARVGKWAGKRGFGTKICLAAGGPIPGGKDESWLLDVVVKAARGKGCMAGLVKDTSYPLRDGSVTHYFPVVTCAYAFGSKHELGTILGEMSLM